MLYILYRLQEKKQFCNSVCIVKQEVSSKAWEVKWNFIDVSLRHEELKVVTKTCMWEDGLRNHWNCQIRSLSLNCL